MNKIVFLDIDGVVNTLMISQQPFNTPTGKIKRPDGYYYNICNSSDLYVSNKQAICWLNKICIESNASIVISSTWRCDYNDTIQSLLNSGLDPRIKILGATKHRPDNNRGKEILDFLSSHNLLNIKYIVLDDDVYDLESCKNHLIHINGHVGLTIDDYYKALQMLS